MFFLINVLSSNHIIHQAKTNQLKQITHNIISIFYVASISIADTEPLAIDKQAHFFLLQGEKAFDCIHVFGVGIDITEQSVIKNLLMDFFSFWC